MNLLVQQEGFCLRINAGTGKKNDVRLMLVS